MMYRMVYFMVLLLLILTGCGAPNDRRAETLAEPLDNVLTLELVFGAEDLDAAYVLARPSPECVGIDIEGNILVVDEEYVKVFGPNGSPKRLLGGSGEGPGEFSQPRIIWMGAEGYFSVLDGMAVHHFRPDHSFIERTTIMMSDVFQEVMEAEHLIPQGPESVYSFGESERVYAIDTRDADRQNRSRKEVYLFYQDSDSLRVLTHYPQSNFVAGPPRGGTITSGVWGRLLVAPLPGKRIVYLHSYHDTEISGEGGASYRLTILDLDAMRQRHIDHHDPAYTPVETSWEPMTFPEEYREQNPDHWRRTQELNRLVEEFVAERQYNCPVSRLYSDDDFIFVFTNTRNDSSDVKVDVFNAERGYLRSAWFSAGFGYIRGGYLCKVSNYFSGEEFPQIEKYRINQRVYRNR